MKLAATLITALNEACAKELGEDVVPHLAPAFASLATASVDEHAFPFELSVLVIGTTLAKAFRSVANVFRGDNRDVLLECATRCETEQMGRAAIDSSHMAAKLVSAWRWSAAEVSAAAHYACLSTGAFDPPKAVANAARAAVLAAKAVRTSMQEATPASTPAEAEAAAIELLKEFAAAVSQMNT